MRVVPLMSRPLESDKINSGIAPTEILNAQYGPSDKTPSMLIVVDIQTETFVSGTNGSGSGALEAGDCRSSII
jgi:hypothetical protein